MVDLPASYVIRPEDTLFIHLLECPQYSCKSILIPPKNINIIEHITYLRVFWSAGWENGYPDFIVLKIDHRFVGGFSPTHLKKIFATSIWIISPNSDENKKYLKPPLSHTLLILQIPTSKSLVSWFTTDSDAGAGGGTGVETLACIRNVAERGWGRYILGSHGVLSIVLTGLLHIFSTSSCRFLPNGNEFLPKKEPPKWTFLNYEIREKTNPCCKYPETSDFGLVTRVNSSFWKYTPKTSLL